MGSLIKLKNMIMFSAVLLTIGSVSAQLAFAGQSCMSDDNGDWSKTANWTGCNDNPPSVNDDILISHNIEITGDEDAGLIQLTPAATLFIDCDASLTVVEGGSSSGNITNHGDLTISSDDLILFFPGTLFNSGTISGVVVEEGGSIVEISSICDRPIGGTVGSMSTTSLLVAGAQANMGLWSLALVGIVGAGAAITYKLKSKKDQKEE